MAGQCQERRQWIVPAIRGAHGIVGADGVDGVAGTQNGNLNTDRKSYVKRGKNGVMAEDY